MLQPKAKYSFSLKLALAILSIFCLVSIFGSWLANEKDILCFGEGKCILPIIEHSPQSIHTELKNKAPGEHPDHILGTDILGRDVAAAMIIGSKQSLLSGIASTCIGGFIGITLGLLAGFFGTKGAKIHIVILLFGIFFISLSIFYLVYASQKWLWILIVILTVVILTLIHKAISKNSKQTAYFLSIPIDLLVTKMIEIRKSIPPLFLLLALLPVFASPSIWNIVIVLSILVWSDFARYTRAETMDIRQSNYIERVIQTGFGTWYILYKHILPNILPTVITVFCFSVGACILAESSISFLGIGIAPTDITWGTMMAEGRQTMKWWMILCPGVAIFMVIWSLNTIANYLQEDEK
jgi:ABC-type dipeptide/oligopeptide/nickel transport system permease subunit